MGSSERDRTVNAAMGDHVACFARAPVLPLRRQPSSLLRRSRCTQIRAVLTVRRGEYKDAADCARCIAQVFRGADTSSAFLLPFVTHVSYLDMVTQLSQRLPRRAPDGNIVHSEDDPDVQNHVLLMAEDSDIDPDRTLGCLEMGVVNMPRLLANGMLQEVENWGQRVKLEEANPWSFLSFGNGDADSGATKNGDRKDAPYIGNLAVDANVRRRGIASRLVKEAETVALRWGYDSICLHVNGDDDGAKAFYASQGYTCTGQEPLWYSRAGRVRKMFLRKDLLELDPSRDPEDYRTWDKAKFMSSGKGLNFAEYLRLCIADLKAQA